MRHPQVLDFFKNGPTFPGKSDPIEYYFQCVLRQPGFLFPFESRELVTNTLSKYAEQGAVKVTQWISTKIHFQHVSDVIEKHNINLYNNLKEQIEKQNTTSIDCDADYPIYEDDDLFARLNVSKFCDTTREENRILSKGTSSDSFPSDQDDYEENINTVESSPITTSVVDYFSSEELNIRLSSPIFQ